MKHICARCGRRFERFEGGINDEDYCHPDDPDLPDCYHIETVWKGVDPSRAEAS